MGKILAIAGACAVVAGGVVFGLFSYSSYSLHHCDRADLASCAVAEMDCCAEPTVSDTTPAMAVAGPLALFGTTPVSTETVACCATGGLVAKSSCCEAPASTNGLVALTGTAAAVK